MVWIGIGIGALVLGGLGYCWYQRRQRSRHRLISLVALVREAVTFDPAVLANVAGRAWKADLGDGSGEGADGFVAATPISSMIMHKGRMTIVNTFPSPYTNEVEEAAKSIVDPRIRELFREHRAWFSCDAMGVDGRTPEEEVRQWYRRLGRLFVGLLDENCLLIYLPDSGAAFPINEDTEAALRSKDPLNALMETMTAPMVEVSDSDPRMQQAVQQAREKWPQFVDAFEQQAGENHTVKAPVTRGGCTEFIWITVRSLEGDKIYGELGNEPANLGALKLGSKVSVPVSDLNDWCYIDAQGEMQGGFTIAVLQQAARQQKKRG